MLIKINDVKRCYIYLNKVELKYVYILIDSLINKWKRKIC